MKTTPNNSIIEKIKKLLDLANSPNENEARAATNKANELLIKYNLSMREINDDQFIYHHHLTVGEFGFSLKKHQKLISSILQKFFFVKIFVQYKSFDSTNNRCRPLRILQLVGTEVNCQIGGYIFDYLNRAYPQLWKAYINQNINIGAEYKKSYYHGLTRGIEEMLDQTKWRVQEETELIIKEDPALKTYMKKIATGTYGKIRSDKVNSEVFRDGYQDGLKINLKKPIKAETCSVEIKFMD